MLPSESEKKRLSCAGEREMFGQVEKSEIPFLKSVAYIASVPVSLLKIKGFQPISRSNKDHILKNTILASFRIEESSISISISILYFDFFPIKIRSSQLEIYLF